jgi:hypothetical protein
VSIDASVDEIVDAIVHQLKPIPADDSPGGRNQP